MAWRGVARSLAYGQAIDDAAREWCEQVPGVGDGTIGFADFVAHAAAWTRGRFGPAAVYWPHVFGDMALLAGSAADGAFFLHYLDEACERLRRDGRLNLAIIGSVDTWRAELEARLHQASAAFAEQQRTALGLPELPIEPFAYQRPGSAWGAFD